MKRFILGITMLTLALGMPSAGAELIASDAVAGGPVRMLRIQLAADLQKAGLTEGEASSRVAAMTDAEVQQLAGRLDDYAAGAACCHADGFFGFLLLIIGIIFLILG